MVEHQTAIMLILIFKFENSTVVVDPIENIIKQKKINKHFEKNVFHFERNNYYKFSGY